MRHRTTLGRVLLGAVAATAVLGLPAGPATAAPAAAPAAGPVGVAGAAPAAGQEIARVTGNGVTVVFVSTAGPAGRPEIALFARGSLRGPVSPVPALLAQRLTSQEMYLTLAGRGAVAPAALAGLQAAEATELGRDATVRAGVLPPAAATNSVTSCQSRLFGDISDWAGVGLWSNKGGVAYPSGSQVQYVGGISTYETRNAVGFAGCNASANQNLTLDYAYNQRFNSLGWQQSGTFPVGPGGWGGWYYKWLKTVNGVPHGASYKIHGSSAGAFELVTGEWFTI
ncbi:MAG: hypothetical protein V7637_589 [Mycobacteriales bacterium]